MINPNPDELPPAWRPVETVRTVLDAPHRHNLIHTGEGVGCRGCDLWVPKPPEMPDYTGAAMVDWHRP